MKVYTRVEYQMTKDGMVEVSSDYYEYDGVVSEAKGGGSPPPEPKPDPVPEAPDRAEITEAKTQAKSVRRRRGRMGSISSLLSGGYRGFGMGDQDKLG